jgi:glutathione peroxidase
MKTFTIAIIALTLFTSAVFAQTSKEKQMPAFYSFTMKTLDGKEKPLSDYQGKVVLVVNTASFCGFTPQYKELEAIYKKYKDKGFVITGFPANNFGQQEPGSNKEIAAFCTKNYDVTFDMFSKISVKGSDMHPLYKYLTTDTNFKGDIGWNFTKFLVDKSGNVVARYESKIKPDSKDVTAEIEKLLAEK